MRRGVVGAAFALGVACGRWGYDPAHVPRDGGAMDASAPPDAARAGDAAAADAPAGAADAPAGTPDAPLPDAGPCPPICNGGCSGGVCFILNMAGTVTCPPGMICDITCDLVNACPGVLLCADATLCRVHCTGERACDDVRCGSGPCEVICSARRSCDAVRCETAPTCDVVCSGEDSCGFYSDCGAGACDFLCSGVRSCAAGVRCSTACACDATCPPDGCPTGMWTHECPPGCALPSTACTSAPAGCNVCP